MNIEYYGHSCFKITAKPSGRGQEDVTIFIDPFDKKVGLRPPQGQADLVLVSHHHYDHDNVSALKGEPVVFDIPGEYSIKNVNVIGLQSYHDKEESDPNTIFLLEAEDLKICHLGDLGCDLTEKQVEDLGEVDVLMIPVGGKYTIDAKKAEEIAKMIEPKIIIPMHYKMPGSTITDITDEKSFCNEIGSCPKEKISKLNIKKNDLEGKSMEVVVMSIE